MRPLLGIDHGEARIGVAVTDTLGMLAHPLETIHVRRVEDPVGRIAELTAERNAEKIIVGMPFRLDGSKGTAAKKVEAFIAKIRKRLPEIEVVPVDERLSTVTAQARLHEAGRTVKNSRDIIDQAAAVTILQDYLDSLAGPESIFDDGGAV